MQGRTRNEEVSPRLIDLIPKTSEERKLELRLGPPGEDSSSKGNIRNINREREESMLSLGYLSPVVSMSKNSNISSADKPAGAILAPPWSSSSSGYQGNTQHNQLRTKASFLQFPSSQQNMSVMANETTQPCCNKVADLQNPEKKAFSPSSANIAVPNTSQKRTAPAPVVGWPPIRSFRKNLASSSYTKPSSGSQNEHGVSDKVTGKKPVNNSSKGLFVKINMDGVPIGRKVDLNAYDSYDKLSSAVDELFRGLLAAQRDSSAGGIQYKQEEEKEITGLLDGRGEYTLVYEDNEGDRMLVGDVPWHMFVSTVKRLRVLKSSDVSSLSLGIKQEKAPLDSALK